MTKQMNLRLDKDLIKVFKELTEHENLDRSSLVRKILNKGLQQERLNLAVHKYILKEISIEKATEKAKLSLHKFISKLSQLGIPFNLSLEVLKKTYS